MIGLGSSTPLRMMRRVLAPRSLTSMLPSGRNAMAQGCVNPLIGTTRYRWPELLKSCGLSDRVGLGGLVGLGSSASWALLTAATAKSAMLMSHRRTMFQRRHVTS